MPVVEIWIRDLTVKFLNLIDFKNLSTLFETIDLELWSMI